MEIQNLLSVKPPGKVVRNIIVEADKHLMICGGAHGVLGWIDVGVTQQDVS